MGDDAMPMAATVDALERQHDYEELDRALEGGYPGASIDDVDEETLRRTLGEPAVRDLRRLRRSRGCSRTPAWSSGGTDGSR